MRPAKIKCIDLDRDGNMYYQLEGNQLCQIAMKRHPTNTNFVMVEPNHKKFYQKCFYPSCAGKEVLIHIISDESGQIIKPIFKSSKASRDYIQMKAERRNDPIIKKGLNIALDKLDLHLSTHHLKVLRDGNSLMRAWILATKDPAVKTPESWKKRAIQLRQEAVNFIMSQMTKKLVDLSDLYTHYPHIKDWDKEFEKLRTYGSDLSYASCALVSILSSYTGISAIVINLDSDEIEYFLPEHLFYGRPTKHIPVVLIRSEESYEALDIPQYFQERVSKIITEIRRERLSVRRKIKDQKLSKTIIENK